MPTDEPTDLFASTHSPEGQTVLAPESVDPSSPSGQTVQLGTFAGDFDLLRELGRGAFARVYLARQRSLGRLVAVKVSDSPGGGEGSTLAALDHPHIVKVFAEVTDPASNRSGLVLQYVSGPHLGEVLATAFHNGQTPTCGEHLLAAVDRRASDPVPFDPSALADRDVYSSGYAAVVCRLGAKLADALALAHTRNVLHCDIKPSNVLLDRYGRPLLADFNVAVQVNTDDTAVPVGGTLAYMSPEQLAAFAGLADQPPVGPRSDLYALGLVLAEALAGKPPPAADARVEGMRIVLDMWSERRVAPDDWLCRHMAAMPPQVWRVLRRCLVLNPNERFPDATALAAALREAADLLDRQGALPSPSRFGRFVTRSPLKSLALFTFLPHLVGSAVNIAYNWAAISLSPAEADRFLLVTIWYNLLIYPACVAAAVYCAMPVVRFLRWPAPDQSPAAELDRLRLRAIHLGRWAAVLAVVGWFPGGVVFPLALTDWSSGIDWARFGHFAVSFTVSGLIAMTYSFLGVLAVVVRGILPRLMHAEQTVDLRRAEAATLTTDLGVIPLAAAVVPLTAAVVQLTFGPADVALGYRAVVTGLIVAGMVGLGVAVWATRRLQKVVTLLTGYGE